MIEKIYIRGTEMAKADDLLNKQETLVSGNNIKTINGISLLGAGDISIGDDGASVDLSNYIGKDNNIAYTPTDSYHPATKEYVDTAVSNSAKTLQTDIGNRLPKLVALHSFGHETDDVQFMNYPLSAAPFVTSSYVDDVNVKLGGMSEGDPDMWSIQEAGYYRITVSMNVELGESASLTMYMDRDWKKSPILEVVTTENYGWTFHNGANSIEMIMYLEAGAITGCAMNGMGAVKFAGMVEMTRIK